MSVLSDLRAELAQALITGGVPAYSFIPERVNPPVAVIAAGNPYVTELFDSKTFNHNYQVNMEITLIASRASNDRASDELDDLICKAALALAGMWDIDVSQPFQLEVNGALYLAVTVSIKTSITIA